ncbi:serine/threonine-protein phosphatase 4 regulatory subunit 2 [Amyelois transitella]|uniref:serine/threonine-protein phosphatase 4 regulatory subunit 2 n=1 Tax=Amyelois transitella TaxID=680683 RepID=UPI0029902ED2|nr:serine/threonine-protein phosphatase 4 regulatory subunit 2 [Amyelois transitella]
MKMENSEEIFLFLEEFSKRKPKTIPQELNEYLAYVARTGDPVYQWPLVKSLFKEKLLNVITDFYETTPGIDIPPYPNVDPFNYDTMKNSLLERLDSFTSAPFTVQRICELLTYPRKQYNRVDKFMRAIEKNILVVSTREPGSQRHIEAENGEAMEPIVNGSDNNSEYNVDVEMEDMAWKENTEQQKQHDPEPQPGSSDSHITVHDIEERLMAKETPMDGQEKVNTQYESVTPPELSSSQDTATEELKDTSSVTEDNPCVPTIESSSINETADIQKTSEKPKADIEMKAEEGLSPPAGLVIPEIQINNVEMTEQELNEQTESIDIKVADEKEKPVEGEMNSESKSNENLVPSNIDESSSDSNKEETEPKLISEVSTSSEESSSSSDITDGNSNSPKTEDTPLEIQEESNQSDAPAESSDNDTAVITPATEENDETPSKATIQSDNYSISDVNSELPQPPEEIKVIEKSDEPPETPTEIKETNEEEPVKDSIEQKAENAETDNLTSS